MQASIRREMRVYIATILEHARHRRNFGRMTLPDIHLIPMTKKFIWIGFFVGSTVGNFVPTLWGGDAISVSGFLWSLAGGILGIWIGYRFGQSCENGNKYGINRRK